MVDLTIDIDAGRVTYPATLTFDGDEMEVAETRDGTPYIIFRNVVVETDDETVERTVMAFGEAMERVAPLRMPGARVTLDVFDSGRVVKVVGELPLAA
jgi:hypothetical protein